jgi:hypothetical protein
MYHATLPCSAAINNTSGIRVCVAADAQSRVSVVFAEYNTVTCPCHCARVCMVVVRHSEEFRVSSTESSVELNGVKTLS